jgi:Mn-dependent DtxR family transcriptional regulator
MGQDDILKVLDKEPNKLFDSNDIKKELGINSSSISQSLKKLRGTDWLGYVNYRDSRYYYYSLNSKRFRNIPRVLRLFLGVRGTTKEEILKYLYLNFGVKQEVKNELDKENII